MDLLVRVHQRMCIWLLWLLLRLAVSVDGHRRRAPKHAKRLRGSLRRVLDLFLVREQLRPRIEFARRRRAWNRTPRHVEEELVRLHVEQPLLGAGQLRHLAERVLGLRLARETVRKILLRRNELIFEVGRERERTRRRIHVRRGLKLWGADLTLVFVLGFFPAWVLGVVDYHGSRLVALERLWWPNAENIAAAFGRAFEVHGVPERLLSDNGPQFRAELFERFLARHSVRHTITRPAHPWTNGRIERLFRTFKETIFDFVWLVRSPAQLDRFCEDFVLFYNRDRPHSAWRGRTPDEVFFARKKRLRPLGRVHYFDGRLGWYRFG